MSEAETARQWLVELEATELVLRHLAVENLPFAAVLRVERAAFRRSEELLAAAGFRRVAVPATPAPVPLVHLVADLASSREPTEELLTGGPLGRQDVALEDARGPAVVAGFEALDEGPEGVADEDGHDLRSDEQARAAAPSEDDLLPEIDELEPLDDDETAESPEEAEQLLDEPVFSDPHGFEPDLEDATEPRVEEPAPGPVATPSWPEPTPEPARSGDASFVSYVAYEEDAPTSLHAVESDEDPTLSRSIPAPAVNGSPPAEDPYAHLVSFAEPAPEQDEELPTPDAEADEAAFGDEADEDWGRRARGTLLSDVGADALVTMDEHGTDIMGDALAARGGDDVDVAEIDEVEELELDQEEGGESFDLVPDTSDEVEVEEDEEVTLVKTADALAVQNLGSSRGPGPAASGRPQAAPAPRIAAAAAGTSGLYGGSTVPTIRDSDDPRPRAAAVQLGSGGQGARMLGLDEEEEPIEIGAAEEDDDDVEGGGAGFSLQVQEYEEEEVYEEEEEEEDEEVIEPKPQEPPPGPSADQLRAMFEVAQNAAANGDLQGGADLFSDLIDQDPDNVDAHVARGRLYLDLGDYSRAMSDFMVAEDLGPENPEPQVAIGDLYFARKDYRKAIDYFNIALEFSPNHAMAHCRRGISHYYRKNYPEAVADLLKAQKLDPDIPNIQTYVSMAKKKSK